MNLVILCHTLRHRQAQIFKIGASSLAWAWDIFNLKGCQLHPWFQMYVKHAELVNFTPGRVSAQAAKHRLRFILPCKSECNPFS